MTARTGRRRFTRAGRRLAVLGAAAALTAALAQTTTTAAFTAQTGNGNQVGTATTFCATPGASTLDVLNDTYVDASEPTTAKGGVTGLVVRSGTSVAHVLLRFQLPSLGQHCRFTGASLRLHATASQGPGTIDVHRASATWTSAAMTWNTAGRPGPIGTGVGAASGTPGWHEWNVTTLVTELSAGPDHGFLLKDRNEGVGTRATTYESLDSPTVANRPELLLTWG
jgi:hypothetical protein